MPAPIHRLTARYGLNPTKIETVVPAIQSVNDKRWFNIIIPKTRDESKQIKREDTVDIKIASNGSGYKGGIGAAAVLWRTRREDLKRLKMHAGSDKEQIVFMGECIGAWLGLHLLEQERDTQGKKISFYIDSQALIRALQSRQTKSGQWAVKELISGLNQWVTQNETSTLTVYWITAHSRVDLNEEVDTLAKQGAKGNSSLRAELPRKLRGEIPLSTSVLKAEHAKQSKETWKAKWSKSTRYERMTAIDPDFPHKKFLKRIEGQQ
ncbi:hypothetical protein DL96DRAFT_1551699 [Flagelloscypha sp. PMI_526]|nr:hypothetical protein DL96DRAFT_1551699 [Flagelloscypha sp. PMI_526]